MLISREPAWLAWSRDKPFTLPAPEGCPTAPGMLAGAKHFSRRLTEYPEVFERATGEHLFPGTVNVNAGELTPVKEHFRIHGKEINEPEEFLFEVCRINGI